MQLKAILAMACALCTATTAKSQYLNDPVMTGGSLSPYTRFGLGHLEDACTSDLMGTGQALSSGNRVNIINPASYSSCDSTTFIFDVGMSAWLGAYSTSTQRVNVRGTRITNATALFRVRRGLGMAIGFVPYSSIGYRFQGSEYVGTTSLGDKIITSHHSNEGHGGLHNIFVGAGWTPYKNLSVGANIGYLWGTYNHQISQTFYEDGTVSSTYNGLTTKYDADLKSFKADIGVQYAVKLSKTDKVSAGASLGFGHKMSGDVDILRYTSNSDTISNTVSRPFDIPWSFGVGLAWHRGTQWIVAADYNQEKWGECHTPRLVDDGSSIQAIASSDNLTDRHRFSVMAEYTPDIYHLSYLQRIRYRIGASYSTAYYKVNSNNGPGELCLGAGLGLPISNNINNRSVVNVGLQWVHTTNTQQSYATENYFRINIGITFNEQWFMKWKIR